MAPLARLLALAGLVAHVAHVAGTGATHAIPNAVYNGPVSVASTAEDGGVYTLPKVTPYVNGTTFEWWYFDVVGDVTSPNESVVVVFYDTTPEAFFGGAPGSPVSAWLSVTFANGTASNFPVKASLHESADIEISNYGVEARWGDTGFGFSGSWDFGKYTVRLDSPQLGVNGTVVMYSFAPAHLPCGLEYSTSDTAMIMPHIGWSNAVPGAGAHVSLDVGGTQLEFDGYGYHDKNWGGIPFTEAVKSWYWGHAQIGPYTLVWFDALASSKNGGEEYVSGYLARDGRVVAASCAGGALKVRPWGKNSVYPPTPKSGNPDFLLVEFDIGQDKTFMANVSSELVLIDDGQYVRYTGPVQGLVVGEELYTGRGLWEQFAF